MPIARFIADTAGLETRLEQAASDIVALSVSERAEMGSRTLTDSTCVFQITTADGDTAQLRALVQKHFEPAAALVTEPTMAPLKVFISDMDSTMIGQECIDELADFAGLKDKVAAITERAMQGEIDFEDALRERVGLLAGLSESTISDCLEQRIKPVPGARELVQSLKDRGCHTVLVTGGFHHFADAVAKQLGFDRVVGNRLEVTDGKLTGGLAGPVVDSATKLAVLEEERAKLTTGNILATGDGANDIPMLEAADFGFAYRAKPKARAAASGWVDSENITAILSLLDV